MTVVRTVTDVLNPGDFSRHTITFSQKRTEFLQGRLPGCMSGVFLCITYNASAIRAPEMLQTPAITIETKASWVAATAALCVLSMAFGAAWITTVALNDIAGEVGKSRSIRAS